MTPKQHADNAPDHFWHRISGADGQMEYRLAAAVVDQGQSGAVDKFWAYSLDGVRVRLLCVIPLTDSQKGSIRAAVGRLRMKNLKGWATYISDRFFSGGLARNDYTKWMKPEGVFV